MFRFYAVLIFAALSSVAATARADAVVVDSTVPGFVRGQIITRATKVLLPEGSVTTFLFRSGQMARVRGPYDGDLSVPETASPSILSAFFETKGAEVSVIGGTRSLRAPIGAMVGRTIAVDASRSASVCLGPHDHISLRLPAAVEPAGTTIEAADDHVRARVERVGVLGQPWPATLSLKSSGRYLVKVDGAAEPAELHVRVIQGNYDDSAAWAAGVALAGCSEQAATLLQQLQAELTPMALFVSTDRGRAARYVIGEPVTLVVQANRDAHVYCFAHETDGHTIRVFPLGKSDDSAISGHESVTFPGPRMPGVIAAAPPAGEETVQCFATDHDVADQMPPDLFADGFRPLPHDLALSLDRLFQALPDTQVVSSTAVLIIE